MADDTQGRRFRVALSFPGEHRARVNRVAELLGEGLGRKCVLYDRWYAAEFNRPNLNLYLPNLYRTQADLVVAFVCDPYRVKKWTGLEWRAFQALLMDQQFDRLMVFRLDDAEIEGLYPGDGWQDMRHMSDAEVAEAILSRVPGAPPAGPVRKPARLFTAKLPPVSTDLFGREDELAWLDGLWADPAKNVVQIVAAGGTGKTALVGNWWQRHKDDADAIFGWSFYSQGSAQDRQTSSDTFFNEIAVWFQLNLRPEASVYTKASAVAEKLREQKVLLLLDGCEPLQETDGSFRDKALQALLQELISGHKGLAVCTTRVRMDLPEGEHRDLSNLTPVCGAEYLEKLGVVGEREQLIEASKEYGNHALALTLLGTYLKDFLDGAVMRRFEIGSLEDEEGKLYAHARRMIAAYEGRFRGTREDGVLRALGYFDRPAEPDALRLVLPPMTDIEYRRALNRLYEARLLLTADPKKDLDCHPLIRAHFAKEATPEGHGKLYEHYKAKPAKEQPDTLEDMQPLFHAIAHGRLAGRHVEARREVYRDRILRGCDTYLTKKLGANGTNLSLLANFFEEPWTRPHPSFSSGEISWLISSAGFALRAVGQPPNAVAPMRASAELARDASNSRNAAVRYSNLAQLHGTLGNLTEAVEAGRESVGFADGNGSAFWRMGSRTTFADALHQSGEADGARRLFEEAERIQAADEPEYPILSPCGATNTATFCWPKAQTPKRCAELRARCRGWNVRTGSLTSASTT